MRHLHDFRKGMTDRQNITYGPTNRLMDRPTERPTDRPIYGDAITHLRIRKGTG